MSQDHQVSAQVNPPELPIGYIVGVQYRGDVAPECARHRIRASLPWHARPWPRFGAEDARGSFFDCALHYPAATDKTPRWYVAVAELAPTGRAIAKGLLRFRRTIDEVGADIDGLWIHDPAYVAPVHRLIVCEVRPIEGEIA